MIVANDKPIFDSYRTLAGPITPQRFGEIKRAIADALAAGNDGPIFAHYRTIDSDGSISPREFAFLKQALAAAAANDAELGVVRSDSRDVSDACIESLKDSEGLRLTAYPDPGSSDGNPWTIGYGSTGPDIRKGLVWSASQAHARFVADIRRFEDQVEKALQGAPTTQAQFDALVHFAYNVGVHALSKSTLLRLHKAGHFDAAAREFGRWNKNDGRVMPGLTKRRGQEAAMYRGN
jgi:GH24 family phage-related lysozyme (muramidase)